MGKKVDISAVAWGGPEGASLHFVFRDEDYNRVGEIIVQKTGVMDVDLVDGNYRDIVIGAAEYIYGARIPHDLMQFAYDISEDPARWNRAMDFIKRNGIEMRYGEDVLMDEEDALKESQRLFDGFGEDEDDYEGPRMGM